MEFKTGRLHVHSENSLKDSASSVSAIAAKAKEIGLDAVALTDHGTVTGWQGFVKACNKEKIKPILGVELYVVENADEAAEKKEMRLHLVLLGMDRIGREAISLIVTASNEHIVRAGKNVYPCADKEIIRKYAGPGSKGYGHVIATSACIGGVIAGLAIQNENYMEEYGKLSPELENQKKYREIYDAASQEQEELQTKKKELSALSKVSYTKRQKMIDKMPDGPEKAKKQEELNTEIQKSLDAAEELVKVGNRLKQEKTKASSCKAKMYSDEKYEKFKGRCQYLEDGRMLGEEELAAKMQQEALEWQDIFGKGNFYIEIQNHFAENEKKWFPVLYRIALSCGIPVTAANDEHMIEKEDAEKRAYLCAMRFPDFAYSAPRPEDRELYFKSKEEFSDAIRQIIGNDGEAAAARGISEIISRCDDCGDVISSEKHYPKYESSWSDEKTKAELEKKAREGIPARYDNWTPELERRLVYELGVIDSMGFQDYFLIVAWYVNIGEKLGRLPSAQFERLKRNLPYITLEQTERFIDAHCTEGIGYSSGPGRGSGAGSIVCYLTGITSIDPIKYDLVFERFLNPERVSMPDIDADFSNQIREVLIDIVRKKYGQNGVAGIMTRGTLGAKYAIQNVAKVYGNKKCGDHKAFLSLADEMSDLIPKTGGKLGTDGAAIEEKFKDNEDAMNILEIARGLEGTYLQTGKHAAGVVIADNGDIRRYTALMWDPDDGSWKTQMDKEEVEQNHLLKMDFLGLKYLDIITETIRLIKERRGITIEPNRLPVEPEVIKTFADADTDSVFQFESAGMKDMLRQFKPSRFEDLILLVAAYRPGPMQFLPEVFKVKNGGKPDYLTPELEPILRDTYGQIIYQEQVMKIFQDLAGYSLGGADLVRRAMGHKEAEKLLRERDAFVNGDPSRNITGCRNNGISEGAANELFSQMEKFASYAFNKSHAAAYAWISYVTAYLKYHYTIEFMSVIIHYNGNSDETKGVKKIGSIIRDCRKHGIEVVCPDVNISEDHPVIYNGKIYLGFNSINGMVAESAKIMKERKENGAFTGIGDVLSRCGLSKRAFRGLGCAGAFDSFCARKVIVENAEILHERTKDIRSFRNEMEQKKEILKLLEEGKEQKATAANGGKKPRESAVLSKIALLQSRISVLQGEVDRMLVQVCSEENSVEMLNMEKEALGVYVSGSPLDSFKPVAKVNGKKLKDLSPQKGRVKLLIMPEDVKELKSRKTGNAFLSFTAESLLGSVHAFCYEEEPMEKLLMTDRPVVVSGFLNEDTKGRENNAEGTAVLTVSDVSDAENRYVCLSAEMFSDEALLKFNQKTGLDCLQNREKPFIVVYCTIPDYDEVIVLNRPMSESVRYWLQDMLGAAVFHEI